MNFPDRQHVVAQLGHFGCNPHEAQVYLRCLESGTETIQSLAKGVGRNRTTVHSEVEQLLKKGLLYESRRGKKRYIGAENPKVLFSLLQQRENDIAALRSNISYAVSLMEKVSPPSGVGVPNVKLYEGVEGFKKMLEETFSAKSEVLVFTNVRLFSELVDPEYLEHYFQRRSDKGIRTRLIFPPCEFAERVYKKSDEYRIRVRLMPEELSWQAGIFSWNNSIAIQSFTEGKLTCTILENADIADFYRRVLFELAWQQAADMKLPTVHDR